MRTGYPYYMDLGSFMLLLDWRPFMVEAAEVHPLNIFSSLAHPNKVQVCSLKLLQKNQWKCDKQKFGRCTPAQNYNINRWTNKKTTIYYSVKSWAYFWTSLIIRKQYTLACITLTSIPLSQVHSVKMLLTSADLFWGWI